LDCPASTDRDVLNLKPITGADSTAVGLFLPLEGDSVKQASFPSPNPDCVGDPTASR